VAEAVRQRGRRAVLTQADVSDRRQVDAMVQDAVRALGRLDILVNNAGVATVEPFVDMREGTWDRTIGVNLKGQFLVGQAAAREMLREGHGGRIVNLSSIASGGVGIGAAGAAAYTASKGGVIGLTESMADELGPKGITVNAIAPGYITTDMTRPFLENAAAREGIVRHIPVGRLGAPEDIAAMAVFLASDEAAYCNGGVFYVDGGYLSE
jgi:3-oxoacyl-[acyl-carrier protein] reductase